MLRLGRVLVTLVGIAAMLVSAFLVFVLIVNRGYFGPDRAIPLAVLFVVLAVAMLVSTVAIMKGRAWGAVLIALWAGGIGVWFLIGSDRQFSAYLILIVLAVATVLATAVAIGMGRDKASGLS